MRNAPGRLVENSKDDEGRVKKVQKKRCLGKRKQELPKSLPRSKGKLAIGEGDAEVKERLGRCGEGEKDVGGSLRRGYGGSVSKTL